MTTSVTGWFGELMDGLEDVQKAEQRPLPGFVMARLGDNSWWEFFSRSLLDLLVGPFVITAQQGYASAARQLGITLVDWQLVLPQVMEWAQEHAAELVTQVTDNIRADIRRIVVTGLQNGEPWRNVRQRIQEIGFPKWRAERIARTEVIRAHARGAYVGYEASGTVRGLRWLDGQAGACPICAELNEQTRRLGEPFYNDRFGDGLPPNHPHCRCAIAPVTLEQVKRLPEEHPLRDNRRESVAELTDKGLVAWLPAVVQGHRAVVTGERLRHIKYQHPDLVKPGLENIIEELVIHPTHIVEDKRDRRNVVHYYQRGDRWFRGVILPPSSEEFGASLINFRGAGASEVGAAIKNAQ